MCWAVGGMYIRVCVSSYHLTDGLSHKLRVLLGRLRALVGVVVPYHLVSSCPPRLGGDGSLLGQVV